MNEIPCLEPVPGIFQLMPVSHTLVPNHRTNCFIIGEPGNGSFIIDPSPHDDVEYSLLVDGLQRLKEQHNLTYKGIFITHHHSDHVANVPRLSRQLAIPIHLSPATYKRLIQKKGWEPFIGIDLYFTFSGDRLTRWQGQDVMVLEVPGHDEGQLALAPHHVPWRYNPFARSQLPVWEGAKETQWFLAGDLVQEKGTVVISSDEGNMAQYIKILQDIINLKPKIVLPSHGQALKGTRHMEDTLKHRMQREAQVLKYYKKGYTVGQILSKLYAKTDPRLLPLAMENIKSHLKKLKIF